MTAIAAHAYTASRYGRIPNAPAAATAGATRVSEQAAAKYLGLTLSALVARRRRGTGPAWYWHMGRRAYDVTALDAFAAGAA